ncbi:hypothetical protein CMI47_20955 [Candidatus Pacearchaeota archaeon]|nr:hypothetical protein [Candidatus Pacearchaeota archaeon]|tara:strand:+ start:669 stop:1232 length:564 start_codon:yes stop_codon:yes gene_type:complete
MISKYYKEAWEYVKESQKYIYFVILLFVLFGVLGAVFSEQLTFIDEILKELLEKTEGLSTMGLVSFIFFNNIQSAFMGLLIGVVFGIFPVLVAITNGVVLGYVLQRTAEVAGVLQFWRLLPHGIFELPAIFISLGLGIKLGMFVFAKKKLEELKKRVYNSLMVFFLIVLPLLIVAAIIEGLLIGLFK